MINTQNRLCSASTWISNVSRWSPETFPLLGWPSPDQQWSAIVTCALSNKPYCRNTFDVARVHLRPEKHFRVNRQLGIRIKYVHIPLSRDDGGQSRLSRSSCRRVDSVRQCPQLFGNAYLDTFSNVVGSATSIDDLLSRTSTSANIERPPIYKRMM